MTLTTPPTPQGAPGPFTVDDLAGMPDDGRRYELVDGALIVTPAPHPFHQITSASLFDRVSNAQPAELLTLYAPFDVRVSEFTQLQPDLLVIRWADLDEDGYHGTPLLVVEVLSPSTRKYDQLLKLPSYAEAGIPSYWIIDPSADAPTLTVYELRTDGPAPTYERTHVVSAGEEVTLTHPFPVTLRPADLVPRGPTA